MMNRFIAGLVFVLMLSASHATQVGTVAITSGGEGTYRNWFGNMKSYTVTLRDNILNRSTNGDISFNFEIYVEGAFLASIYSIKFKCTTNEVEYNATLGTDNKEVFTITIPRTAYQNLGNGPFAINCVDFTNANGNVTFNPGTFTFTITPTVTLSANTNDVNFGALIYDNGRITNQGENPQVTLEYAVLNNARCKLESTNEFNLKHESGTDLIKYEVTGGAETAITAGENANIKYIALEYNKVQKILNFNVNTDSANMPTAGNYKDTITCSIVATQ